jgi:transposase
MTGGNSQGGGTAMTSDQLFAAALGITAPWFVQAVDFDASQRRLTIHIDFAPGSRFAHAKAPGEHPVHDTQIKRLRHLNFFQHECHLEVRVPRVRLPDGKVALVEPDWVGKLAGFTLLFEALVLMLAQQMPFAAVARIIGESWHKVHAVCCRYVDLALAKADLSALTSVAIDETSYRRGHSYLTLAADADARKVVFVAKGRDALTVAGFAQYLRVHKADPANITAVTIDMSPAFIKGVGDHLPNAKITFDKFHVVAHASQALDETRRREQKTDPALKGLRWALLKDRSKLSRDQATDLERLVVQFTTKRTARAWLYREQLRDILDRKQINVVSAMLTQWCTNVMRSKVEPMKQVAAMIRSHFDGIVAWARSRQTSGFIEALNGLFQAAKRKARGYTRFQTMKTVLFLIAGKLNFSAINPHAA